MRLSPVSFLWRPVSIEILACWDFDSEVPYFLRLFLIIPVFLHQARPEVTVLGRVRTLPDVISVLTYFVSAAAA